MPTATQRISGHVRQRCFVTAAGGAFVVALGICASLAVDRFGLVGPVALALVNIALVLLTVTRLAEANPLSWLPILSFLPGVAVSWPVTTVYFAIFSPDARTVDAAGGRCLDHAEWLQIAVFVFLCAYLCPLILHRVVTRPDRPGPETFTGAPRVAGGLTLCGVLGVTAGWVASVPGLSAEVAFGLAAARNYLSPLMFVAGFRFRALQRWLRWLVGAGLATAFVANTIANSRGYAVWPLILFVAGLGLSPLKAGLSVKRIVLAGIVAFPLYMTVANQTRAALGTVGLVDFSERTEVLRQVVSGGVIETGASSTVESVMTRLFSGGGSALIANSWVSRPSDRFEAQLFFKEVVLALWPKFLGGMDLRDSRHFGTGLLRQYGFIISDETSADSSMIGHLVYLGGAWGLVIGGFAVGLLHLFLSRTVSRHVLGNGLGLGVAAGIVSMNAWAYNVDVVTHLRMLLWATVYITLAYIAIRFVLRAKAPR